MISKSYRFHGHGSLNYLHQHGVSQRSAHMMVKYTPNSRRQLPRFAVVVSKKILKSAVKRNRVRRRIYEIIRRNIQPDSPSVDMVFNVYSTEVLNLPADKLFTEVKGLLTAAGL